MRKCLPVSGLPHILHITPFCNCAREKIPFGVQVQRARAAMEGLPKEASLEGLLWYQVGEHLSKHLYSRAYLTIPVKIVL